MSVCLHVCRNFGAIIRDRVAVKFQERLLNEVGGHKLGFVLHMQIRMYNIRVFVTYFFIATRTLTSKQ